MTFQPEKTPNSAAISRTLTYGTRGEAVVIVQEDEEQSPRHPNHQRPDTTRFDTTDGGYGWLVVAAASMFCLSCAGRNLSWGVYQDILQRQAAQEPYAMRYSDTELSLVGTLGVLITQAGTLLVTWWRDLRHVRCILFASVLLQSGGLAAAASASKIWELYLYYSIVSSLGGGVMYGVGMRIVPLWFTTRRNTAMSIIGSQAGLGGLLMPVIMTAATNKFGIQWSFRIIAIMLAVLNFSAIAFVRRPRTPGGCDPSFKKERHQFGFQLFKDPRFTLWNIVGFLHVCNMFLPHYVLPSYATYLGLSSWQASSLSSVLSVTLFMGRISCGILADRIGPINTTILYYAFTALGTLVLWMTAYNYGSLMAFAVVFGFFGGTFFALYGPITIAIVGLDKYPEGVSWIMLTHSPAIFAPTVANMIEAGSSLEPYLSYKILSGVAATLITLLSCLLKIMMDTRLKAKI